jgi:hypothetical protein
MRHLLLASLVQTFLRTHWSSLGDVLLTLNGFWCNCTELKPNVLVHFLKKTCLVFWSPRVQISACIPAILTEVFWSLRANGSFLDYAMTASFHILSSSSFTYHPFIQIYIVWATERALFNKLKLGIFTKLNINFTSAIVNLVEPV